MRVAFIVGIFLGVIFNLKTNCASQSHQDTELEELEENEKDRDSDIFKPTHEWQVVREGNFET
jgi:uncharacterized membrane-anchored protein YhcB (DUF1043 family)